MVWGVVGCGVCPSQFPEHLVHLVCINGGVVPCHPITSGTQVATDLPVHHAADELLPGGLNARAVGHTCLGGVVEEFIVADPEGSVPGLVVGVTVHGVLSVDVLSIEAGSLSGGR